MTKEQDDFVEDTRELIKWNNEKTKESLSDPHPDWPAVESLISIIDSLKKKMEDAVGLSVDSHRREDNAVLKIDELTVENKELKKQKSLDEVVIIAKKSHASIVEAQNNELKEINAKIDGRVGSVLIRQAKFHDFVIAKRDVGILETKLKEAEKGLDYYADEKMYKKDSDGDIPLMVDCGPVFAQRILKSIRKE